MNRRSALLLLAITAVMLLPFRSPAPLIYTPGEGWTYEAVGEGRWQRDTARQQIAVAQEAFDNQDYGLALRAARRTVRVWPLSDYAPQAQYLVARSHDLRGRSERAFKEYQKLIETYPSSINFQEALTRQYEIANRFLEGEWFKLWDIIPFFPSMEKTADLYAQVVKNGPYSEVAPRAQMKIGEAREKQSDYPQAVQAYERAADRYSDRPAIASDALFKAGLAYNKQAHTAEYDQSTAGQAIATFTDFLTLYPNDERKDEAGQIIEDLRIEQARGNFEIAKYYEGKQKLPAALIYYNEVLREPASPLADDARARIDTIRQRLETAAAAQAQ